MVLEDFYFPSGTVLTSLLLLAKEEACVKLGLRTANGLEKAKSLVKQIEALGIFLSEFPFELDVFVMPKGMGWALWQKKQKDRVPIGFWSHLWKGPEIQYTSIEQKLLGVYTMLL